MDEKQEKKELTPEQKEELIRKYEKKMKKGSDLTMLRKKSDISKNKSKNICDTHWDGA